ncbi:MAG: threonine/serine dehydratase [Acidobacteriota bacterium]
MMDVTFEDIKRAAERIKGVVRHTPLERSRWLSDDGRKVLLKLECFQATGSFKLRGAMSRISSLTEEERRRGILTVSAGNHGLAVAHCAERLGLDATIVVPSTGSPAKIEAIRRYPVTLLARGENYDEAEREAREMERASGKVFISPYNDPQVIAGQGTVAMEILTDDAGIDAIVVPTSGGGLLAGVLIAAKAINPRIKVYGAEPAASPTMKRSLEAGRIVEIEEDATIADGLAGNIEQGSITFPIIERLVDEIILVDEDAIKRAIARVAREDHLIIEGAAAVGIAALDRMRAGRVAAIVTGRNIAMKLFTEVARSY